MKFYKLFVAIFVVFVTNNLMAQSNSRDKFIGTWKGTSLCQVKNSPCHDEVVVYYITKGSTNDSCLIQANKIVNGVEEEMGVLGFKLGSASNQIISTAYGEWNFKLEEGKLKGILIDKGRLYRIIELTRVQ